MIQLQEATTGLDQADAGTLIAQAQGDSTNGTWNVWSNRVPILPVHAVLLPPDSNGNSNILFFSGSGNDPTQTPNGGVVADYINQNFSAQIAAPVDANNNPLDLFCVGQLRLSNGNVLAAGGTYQYNNTVGNSSFYGLIDTFVFDRNTRQWTVVQPMAGGRWYPTLVTLGDARVLAVSGLTETGTLNVVPEIYSSANNSWTAFQATSQFALYAHLFLLQDGRVFYSGAYFDPNYGVYPRILTLSTDPFTETPLSGDFGGLQEPDSGNQAASVLLPPAQDQRVMIIGGGNPNNATARVNIVNLNANNPTYQPAAYLKNPRMHLSAVLLPDRTVFVCNGSKTSEQTDAANTAIPAEIYDPAADTWTQVATPNVQTRVYHSVALLLPDGRVVTAGGNPQRLNDCLSTNTLDQCTSGERPLSEELRVEVYSPPYLFRGTRPVIGSAPQTVTLGQTITIQTAQARNIQWVHLIRPMSTTHSLDTEQRLVDLPISSTTDSALNVTVTNNPNLAPPGWYMLFITDTNRIPSVASWVQLTGPASGQTNLIQDGGFENQTSSTLSGPWYNGGSGGGGIDYNVGKARTGNNNGWANNTTNTWSAINQQVSVQTNTNYTLTAYVRNSGNFGNNGYVGAFGNNTGSKYETTYGPSGDYSAGYMAVTVNFNSGNDNSMTIYIGFVATNGSGWVQIDDVSLT